MESDRVDLMLMSRFPMIGEDDVPDSWGEVPVMTWRHKSALFLSIELSPRPCDSLVSTYVVAETTTYVSTSYLVAVTSKICTVLFLIVSHWRRPVAQLVSPSFTSGS